MPIICSSKNILDERPKSCFLTMSDEKTNTLFYGVELEVVHAQYKEAVYDISGLIKRTEDAFGDYVILKPDGHFEIVTVPATLRFHKEKLWTKWFKDVAKDAASNIHCGLHIHFSRDALTPLQLAKVMCFVHEKTNEKFISDIAGRPVNPSVSWCRNKIIKKDLGTEGVIAQTSGCRDAISISKRNRSKSVEVRIFASNPTEQGVFQALEFVDAIIKYAANNGTLEKEISYKEFLTWFEKRNMSSVYPYLQTNLERLGYSKKKNSFGLIVRKTIGSNFKKAS